MVVFPLQIQGLLAEIEGFPAGLEGLGFDWIVGRFKVFLDFT